jgi:hypothetical protein
MNSNLLSVAGEYELISVPSNYWLMSAHSEYELMFVPSEYELLSVPGIPADVCLLLADVCVPCVYKFISVSGD